jgi:tRNA1Val (adenine37-N6)-methyltransferase
MSAKAKADPVDKIEKVEQTFQFKQFSIQQDKCSMKVGTDGVLLGAWADVEKATRILDIGTGSGLIAIMLGQRNAMAQIHAVEIDDQAYLQATENMENAPWADRLTAFHQSIQEFAEDSKQEYDLIVSNPPFFTGGTFSFNQDRNSVRHTVKLPHGDMLRAVQKLLVKTGKFCVILPFVEGLRFQELATSYHFYCTRVTEVLTNANKPVERLLMQFELESRTPQRDQLIVRQEGPIEWTEAYQNLTRAFYLKM